MLDWIDKLQKENSQAVGFIQKSVWEELPSPLDGKRNFVPFSFARLKRGCSWVRFNNSRQEGYTMIRVKFNRLAIRNDARRLQYEGQPYLDVCQQLCEHLNVMGFTLRCRQARCSEQQLLVGFGF